MKMIDIEVDDLQMIAHDHLQQIKEFYTKDPSLLIEQYELERKARDEYDGRQLLELIQNADDAAKTASDKKGLVHLDGDKLIMANTGEPFTKGGLDSILHSNLSPKFNEANQIGNKGLGFRAILSWAKKVTIKSGSLNISFSKDYSHKVLNELITRNAEIKKKIVHRYKRLETAIATLRCPEIVDDLALPPLYREYDTVIILDLKQNIKEEVRKQLVNTVDAEMMLFLNHLDHLEIKTETSRQILHRSVLNEKLVSHNRSIKRLLISVEKDGLVSNYEWNINSVRGVREAGIENNAEEKNYELSVAWQDDLQESKNLLHSYFRTDVQFKFPGILHGTFELSSNRNELIKGEGHNAFLFAEAAKLITDTAELIATNEEENVSYNAMNLVMVDFNSLSLLIKESGFESILKDEVKNRRIFPTISNRFIDWDSKPVYYREPEFAEILNPDRFSSLLLCCETTEQETFLKSLSPFVFRLDYLIKEVSSRRSQISISEYAQLISVIHSQLTDKTAVSDLPPLFFDDQFNLLDFAQAIFLPSSSTNYSLPIEVGVQIIHPLLANELQKLLNLNSAALLVQSLSKYFIKEFKFIEIVEALIDHYYQGEGTKGKQIKELQKHLFDLYKKEGSAEFLWKGKAIYFINKLGEVKNSNQLYLGKEYENKLVEELYSYDRSKLIAGPKRYEIEENNLIEWKKYLSWTGVASLPRRLVINGNPEYAKYSMRKFDFKDKVEDYSFKNYAEFEKELTGGYGSINVTSIDEIDKILLYNNSNTVLGWINSDERLMKELEADQEVTGNYITFSFYNTRARRFIYGGKMKNYIKWKLMHKPWLLTESGINQCPFLCTTAATITQEFTPLIEKPLIDFESLRVRGINKDKLDYIFSLIGVHKTINTFSTSTLYSILLKLPEIDPEGKKARVIYNQLATNFEERLLDRIDRLDDNYKEFQTKGKVFTKRGKTNSYVSMKDTYYVNDKRFGESIISQFNTIYIERRRGKHKIKALFGVAPLDNVKLKLVQEELPLHPLQSDFELELENFKPYVYVLRQAADNGSEKNLIKDVKLRLVSELSVLMIDEDRDIHFKLEPFEFFYLKSKNEVFIKTPLYLDDIKSLKSDIYFSPVVAEVFSSLLDVESQRLLIQILFSNSIGGRDEIIRTELDDYNLSKLTLAKENLGISNDPKTNFWISILKCFPSKKLISLANKTDVELMEVLIKAFPFSSEIIKEVFNEINYNEINEEHSSALIIQLLKSLKITIEKLNHFYYPSFNIQELYEINFRTNKEQQKGKFNCLFFERCLLDDNLKFDFLTAMSDYSTFKPTVVNEVDFDVALDLVDKVKVKYSIDLNSEVLPVDFESIFLTNKQTLILQYKEQGVETSLIEQFLNENIRAQSLLFFNDKVSAVINFCDEWLTSSNKGARTTSSSSKSKRITFGNEAVFFDDYSDLRQQLDEIISQAGIGDVKIVPIKIAKTDKKASSNNGDSAGYATRKPSKPKEDIGFLGEYLVYKHLLNVIENKESVQWVSENARKCNINLKGIDGLGYDIIYIPNGSVQPRYVEVKVVGWQDAFYMSSTEVKVGEKLKRHFEVFLVRDIETPSKVRIEKIAALFDYKGRSFADNELFTVLNDNFILKFNKVL